MLEPLNSLDTDSYIEKSFFLILFFAYLLSSLSYLLSSLSGDPYLVQSEMILSFLYPQFNIDGYIPHIYSSLSLIFPMQFGILERSILLFFFFVLASTFPNESKGMSHYDLDCIFLFHFICILILSLGQTLYN